MFSIPVLVIWKFWRAFPRASQSSLSSFLGRHFRRRSPPFSEGCPSCPPFSESVSEGESPHCPLFSEGVSIVEVLLFQRALQRRSPPFPEAFPRALQSSLSSFLGEHFRRRGPPFSEGGSVISVLLGLPSRRTFASSQSSFPGGVPASFILVLELVSKTFPWPKLTSSFL